MRTRPTGCAEPTDAPLRWAARDSCIEPLPTPYFWEKSPQLVENKRSTLQKVHKSSQDAEYKSIDSQTRLEKSELECFGIVGQSDGFELEEGRKKLRSPTLAGADAFVATIPCFTIYVY
jgi:hypothetical protein